MFKILETDRIIMRNFIETDLNDLYDYAKVPGVGEMAGWPTHESIEESQRILSMFLKDKNQFAIVWKETGKVIGGFGIKEVPEDFKDLFPNKKCVEYGYVLSKDYWGRGIVPEVFNKITSYLFSETDIDLITIEHFIENSQSRRVIEKCGGVFYRDDVYYAAALDKHFDAKRYIINKEDYHVRY